MLDLTPTERHLVIIVVHGTEVGLYRRTPTTKERIDYQAATIQSKKNRLAIDHAARLKYGLALLTGIREGDLGFEGKALSSDPKSPHYRQDWKDILRDHRADLVMGVALDAFETSVLKLDEGDDEAEPPFSSN